MRKQRNLHHHATVPYGTVRVCKSSSSFLMLFVLCAVTVMIVDKMHYANALTNQQLLQLFNDATGGASWFTQWSGSNMCTWKGVTCNNNSGTEVRGLSLVSNNLRGDFPNDILRNLTSLRTLQLGGNYLTGSLTADLATLTQMQTFDVSSNSIRGTLPPELGAAWPALAVFRVFSNQLNGSLPPAYSSWLSLSEFFVYSNYLTGSFPDSYGGWSLLTVVKCQDNNLSGTLPASFKQWTRLLFFGVARNQLSGTLPQEYASWVKLTTFDISTNSVTGSLPDNYSAWNALDYLNVAENSLSGTLPVAYQHWTVLTNFIIAGNSISGALPEEYGAWGAQMSFYAHRNNLSGSLPSVYSNWTALSEFTVYSNMLTGSVPASYSNWSLMSYFKVDKNNLNGTLSASFSRWTALQTFTIANNNFSGTLPDEYGSWGSQMTECVVDGNLLTGSLPSTYGAWTSLVNFSAGDNHLSGTIPSSYAEWTSLQFLYLSGNSLEGTLPLFIAEYWRSIRVLDFGRNLFSGTIPASYSLLNASIEALYLQCNQLFGSLPDTLGAMSMLNTLLFSGNRNINGILPSAWGGPSSTLKLNALGLQNTSVSGTIPLSWSTTIQATGSVALCYTNLCGGAGGLALTFSFCVDDVATCNPTNQTFLLAHATLYSLTSLRSCSETTQPPSSPPSSSTQTPTSSPASPSINLSTTTAQQTAVVIATAPVGILTALAGSATLSVGVVRAGASTRLLSCGDGVDLDALAGGYIAAYSVLCSAALCLMLWRWHTHAARWSKACEHLGMPGQLWVVLSSVVFPLVEFGLSLVLLHNGGEVLGAVSFSMGMLSVTWLFSIMTLRFRAVWRVSRAGGTASATSNALSTWIMSRFKEYDSQRVGRWMDTMNSSTSSFVECSGAVFEEYGCRRTWFVLWENGVAAILSVLSAVSRLSSSACSITQVVGAVLQMCCLPVLVTARPHRKAKALLLAVAMEAFGFVGGLCLLVSVTTSIDGDPWGDAASVVLQVQLYAGVALLIFDGLQTGRMRDTLRQWFGLQVGAASTVLLSEKNAQALMRKSGGRQSVQRIHQIPERRGVTSQRTSSGHADHVKSSTTDDALRLLVEAICTQCRN